MTLEYSIIGILGGLLIIAIIIGIYFYFKKKPIPTFQKGRPFIRKPGTTPISPEEDFGMYEDSLATWLESHPPTSCKDFTRIKNVGSLNIPDHLQKPFEFDACRFKNQTPGELSPSINPDFKHYTRTLN